MYSFHAKLAQKKGFTLVETLIAISIISIALVTATATLQNSLQTSNAVKDQITAYYLAEDAIEYTLALRDAGAATPQGWTSKILQCMPTDVVSSVICGADTVNGYSDATFHGLTPCLTNPGQASTAIGGGLGVTISSIAACATPASSPATQLYLCNALTGPYYASNRASDGTCVLTKFSRTLTFTPVQLLLPGDMNTYSEVVLTVKVSWGSSPFSNQSYTLAEDLYNWQPAS